MKKAVKAAIGGAVGISAACLALTLIPAATGADGTAGLQFQAANLRNGWTSTKNGPVRIAESADGVVYLSGELKAPGPHVPSRSTVSPTVFHLPPAMHATHTLYLSTIATTSKGLNPVAVDVVVYGGSTIKVTPYEPGFISMDGLSFPTS